MSRLGVTINRELTELGRQEIHTPRVKPSKTGVPNSNSTQETEVAVDEEPRNFKVLGRGNGRLVIPSVIRWSKNRQLECGMFEEQYSWNFTNILRASVTAAASSWVVIGSWSKGYREHKPTSGYKELQSDMEKHSGPGEDEMKKLEPDLSVPRKLPTVQIPVFFPTGDLGMTEDTCTKKTLDAVAETPEFLDLREIGWRSTFNVGWKISDLRVHGKKSFTWSSTAPAVLLHCYQKCAKINQRQSKGSQTTKKKKKKDFT
ncbi:hypothetical protein B0H14DRAFT_2606667 [Mycena olivaceomarginata]|nr:hypothetical protein B0H14DRAFT_2606667 [Mycena olivaceomarginata]